MGKILIIRHAQSEGNAKGILMGSSKNVDSQLSTAGVLATHLKGKGLKASSFLPDKIYSSELNRAKQTAEIIRDELGITIPIIELAELNERSFGQYEGQPYEQVFKAFDKYDDNPPTVEKVNDFVKRVLKGLEIIKQQNEGTVLVVTHSNPLAVIRCSLYHPDKIQKFWEFEDDDHLEGLTFEF